MYGLCSRSSSIASYATSSKHLVKCDRKSIEVTVTDRAAIANDWIREMLHSYAGEPTVVGLDIEWRPYTIRNKAATLQLCTDKKCLILQLFYIDETPLALKTFLQDSNITFVGVDVSSDIKKLRDQYGLVCSKSADMHLLAKNRWPGRFSRTGLKDLAMQVCGLPMQKPKHVTLSNWEARHLTPAQVDYACIDAYASYKLGHKLLMEN